MKLKNDFENFTTHNKSEIWQKLLIFSTMEGIFFHFSWRVCRIIFIVGWRGKAKVNNNRLGEVEDFWVRVKDHKKNDLPSFLHRKKTEDEEGNLRKEKKFYGCSADVEMMGWISNERKRQWWQAKKNRRNLPCQHFFSFVTIHILHSTFHQLWEFINSKKFDSIHFLRFPYD